jgi:hypothetical protein
LKPTKAINQMFKVPNNEEGRFFIYLCKKYASDGIGFRIRGRHPNAAKCEKAGRNMRHMQADGSVPQELADALGVYVLFNTHTEQGMVTIGARDMVYFDAHRQAIYNYTRDVEDNRRKDIAIMEVKRIVNRFHFREEEV